MSEDDYDTVPPPKIKESPKGWVLKFDDEDDAFYYNRTLKIKPTRTPIDASEFKTWKIKVNKKCILKIDEEGDPYYICINEGKQETSRTAPVRMNKLFPYGIELLLTPPFYKELDENKMVEKSKEKSKEKPKTDLSAYLEALAKGIQCDEDTPCDGDHECDLESKKCVPKSDTSYYDDLKRHEENGTFFVGKTGTIERLVKSFADKKAAAAKEAAKEEKEKKKAAEAAAKEEKEKKKAAEAAAKEEKEKKKAAGGKKAADKKKGKEEKEGKEDEDLSVDDVLDTDFDNLSELQKALIDCLMPS